MHDLSVLSNWRLTKVADGHSRFPGRVRFQHMELQRCHGLAMASPAPRSGRGTALASGRTRGKEATQIPVLEMAPAGGAGAPRPYSNVQNPQQRTLVKSLHCKIRAGVQSSFPIFEL